MKYPRCVVGRRADGLSFFAIRFSAAAVWLSVLLASCSNDPLQDSAPIRANLSDSWSRFRVVESWTPRAGLVAYSDCPVRGFRVEVYEDGTGFVAKTGAPRAVDSAVSLPWNHQFESADGVQFEVPRTQLRELISAGNGGVPSLSIQDVTFRFDLPTWIYPGISNKLDIFVAWFASHQEQDGHWSMNGFGQHCRPRHEPDQTCMRSGGCVGMEPGCTGLLIAACSHLSSPESLVVPRAEDWFVEHELDTGGWSDLSEPWGILSDSCAVYGLADYFKDQQDDRRVVDGRIRGAYERAVARLADPDTIQQLLCTPHLDDDERLLSFGWLVLAIRGGVENQVKGCSTALRYAEEIMDKVVGTRSPRQSAVPVMLKNRTREAIEAFCSQTFLEDRGSTGGNHMPQPIVRATLADLESIADVDEEWLFFMTLLVEKGILRERRMWQEWTISKTNYFAFRDVLCSKFQSSPCGLWPLAGGRLYATALKLVFQLRVNWAATASTGEMGNDVKTLGR